MIFLSRDNSLTPPIITLCEKYIKKLEGNNEMSLSKKLEKYIVRDNSNVPITFTLSELCRRYDLKIKVVNRGSDRLTGVLQFYAQLNDVEIREGNILIGSISNGNTENEALEGLAAIYDNKILVVNSSDMNKKNEIGPFHIINEEG